MANEYLSRLRGTMLNFFRIGSTSGIAVKNNSGIGEIRTGDDTGYADLHLKKLKILGSNVANGIVLDVPNGLAGNVTYILPGTDGASGQVLKTDGAGTLYFADASADSVTVAAQSFTEATSSPLTIFTPPANARLMEIRIIVSSAAAGGTPTCSVGISGQAELYMTAAESDLKTAGVYIINPYDDVGGSPSAIQLTITPSAQTFSGIVVVSYKS